MRAIETRYAGCRFRSRLEARWAVFFDAAGIPWTYEPQGYYVGPDIDRSSYLPDFYLPRHRVWVEVKGDRSSTDFRKLAYAVHPDFGLPMRTKSTGAMLLLLGNVPNVLYSWTAWHQLVAHSAYDECWNSESSGVAILPHRFQEDQSHHGTTLESGAGSREAAIFTPEGTISEIRTGPSFWQFDAFVWGDEYFPEWGTTKKLALAYRKARSARFEYGQFG